MGSEMCIRDRFWSTDVKSASASAEKNHGVGSCRVCTLSNGLEIQEEFIEWSEGEKYTYQGTGLPGVDIARNTWSVADDGDSCLITSESVVAMKYGFLGWILEKMLYPLAVYKGKQALRSIAFMAENGRPMNQASDKLPAFLSRC